MKSNYLIGNFISGYINPHRTNKYIFIFIQVKLLEDEEKG